MTVHQTLHGYADGHRLLASSVPLATEEQHLLALLSDISGQGSGVAFDHYLSGYPVRAGLYALARTWRATDVARAGSVWTHTLLITDDDLGELHDLTALVALFRRPEAGDWLPYSTPIELPSKRVAVDRQPPASASPEVTAQVVGYLYEPSGPRAVRLITDDRDRWESFVLGCWLQQWPRLRPALTFCTLALGDLNLNGVPFALQVVPRERRGDFPTGDQIVTIDADAAMQPVVPRTAWIQAAVADLAAGREQRSLREFLWRYGDDVTGGRAALARLADVYTHVTSVPPGLDNRPVDAGLSREGVQHAIRLAGLIGDRFPTPQEAGRLKIAVFGGPTAPESHRAGFSEAEAILALAITRFATAFDSDGLALADRAGRLLETDAAGGVRVVQAALEVGLNPLGEVALAPLLSGAGGALLATAVTDHVGFAANPGLWSTPPDARRAIWHAVKALDARTIDEATRVRVIHAMLDAECAELADEVVAHFGESAVHAALGWLEQGESPTRRLDTAWTSALGREPVALLGLILEERPIGPASFAALAEALDPAADSVSRVDVDTWLGAAARAAKVSPEPINFKAFLLAVALDRQGPEAASVAVLTFQSVYDAAREQKLGAFAWSRLQSRVPRILRQWDHCERLRRGVAVRFARGDWPMTYLPQVVRGELTLDLLLGHCMETEAGRRFVVRVVKGMPLPIRWGQAQRTVVQRFAAKAAARQPR